ncbi:hypothetical protein BN2537_13253 [Streptomyces venezuelae]|nr:hypothetical protein BN2537_13253 [Streptomyces venezuelae]
MRRAVRSCCVLHVPLSRPPIMPDGHRSAELNSPAKQN